jgi:Zn-dependent protease
MLRIDATLADARCDGCGSDVAAGMLVCPSCQRFVHASTLNQLKRDADNAARAGDRAAEIAAWRSAAALLPPESRQYAAVAEKLSALTRETRPPGATGVHKSGPWRWLGGLASAGAVLLTKGKFLLLGLTKATTLFSMLLAFGVYWTAWGMWFAAGLVLSIYVHEMGHVAALRRYGIPATAPMFIPGVGAVVRLGMTPLAPHEDARIGLAGPIWGLGAALAALIASRAGGGPMLRAIAHVGAWVNIFNLLPVWQLDGNRGFRALSRPQRLIITLTFVTGWLVARDGVFALLVIAAVARTFDATAPAEGDRGALAQFMIVIVALAVVCRISALNM